MPSCRLLPYAVADGLHNMAADEVLLESALTGVASARLYGWTVPTVSLGYFQPHAQRHANPCIAALPFVRRPSGGAALVHDREVTYALGLPAGAPWQTGSSWLCRMHEIVIAALRDLGVTALSCAATSEERFAGLLCYHHLTPGDLLIGPAKVVGSAQRRHRGALIQHGSILLAASSFAPELPGVAELTGKVLSVEETCRAVASRFARTTGWQLEAGTWTSPERGRLELLATNKYGQEAWNYKR
jgi:lipoate-protein ligase A